MSTCGTSCCESDIGSRGAEGNEGNVGSCGAEGDVGSRGAEGNEGDIGPCGPQGPTGSAGVKGITPDYWPTYSLKSQWEHIEKGFFLLRCYVKGSKVIKDRTAEWWNSRTPLILMTLLNMFFEKRDNEGVNLLLDNRRDLLQKFFAIFLEKNQLKFIERYLGEVTIDEDLLVKCSTARTFQMLHSRSGLSLTPRLINHCISSNDPRSFDYIYDLIDDRESLVKLVINRLPNWPTMSKFPSDIWMIPDILKLIAKRPLALATLIANSVYTSEILYSLTDEKGNNLAHQHANITNWRLLSLLPAEMWSQQNENGKTPCHLLACAELFADYRDEDPYAPLVEVIPRKAFDVEDKEGRCALSYNEELLNLLTN